MPLRARCEFLMQAAAYFQHGARGYESSQPNTSMLLLDLFCWQPSGWTAQDTRPVAENTLSRRANGKRAGRLFGPGIKLLT
jgi:hypothetical protein